MSLKDESMKQQVKGAAEKTKGQTYKGYIPAGPPPVPKD